MKISVSIICLGAETRTLEINKGEDISAVLKNAEIKIGDASLYINVKIPKSYILHDGDIVFIIQGVKGAADVKYKGKRWRIYLTDKDTIFPSDFHAHCYDSKEVLDLYNGNIFDKVNHKYKTYLKEKRLCELLKKIVAQYGDSPITRKAKSILANKF